MNFFNIGDFLLPIKIFKVPSTLVEKYSSGLSIDGTISPLPAK